MDWSRVHNHESQPLHVILYDGTELAGIRHVYRQLEGGIHQTVEFRGEVREDPETYTGKSDPMGMIWEARRLLVDIHESGQPPIPGKSGGSSAHLSPG